MVQSLRYLTFLFCLLLFGMVSLPALAQTQDAANETALATHTTDTQTTKANDTARRQVQAMRRELAVSVDGRLDEPAWLLAPIIDGFKQREPVEGAEPSERTVVRVLYDDEAIFIGAAYR